MKVLILFVSLRFCVDGGSTRMLVGCLFNDADSSREQRTRGAGFFFLRI